MTCKECKCEIENLCKYLAYYSAGKPIYWALCESCIRKRWMECKKGLNNGNI